MSNHFHLRVHLMSPAIYKILRFHTHKHLLRGRLHELHFVMDTYIHITCKTLNCISLTMAQ